MQQGWPVFSAQQASGSIVPVAFFIPWILVMQSIWWRTLRPALHGLGLGLGIERLVRLGAPALPALARLGCVFLTLVSMLLLLLFFIAATRHCGGRCVVDEATAGMDPAVGAGLLPSSPSAFYSTLLFSGFVGLAQSGRD